MQQTQPRRRRRAGSTDAQQRSCPHCGRSFKRSEHLERHVRTHTKEKPYICHCGSAYSRRDLLTRHQRISHENSNSPDAPVPDDGQHAAIDSDAPSSATTNASLSDMGMNQWIPQGQYLDHQGSAMADPHHAASQSYHQQVPSQEYYHDGQSMQGFDNTKDYTDFADQGSMPVNWNPYYYDGSMGQHYMDPAMQGFMYDGSTAAAYGDRQDSAYNH